MVRRITPSQFRSKVKQMQSKQRQKINEINRAIRKNNTARKQAIDKYNRGVRARNTRVRASRARLRSALKRLSQQTITVRYTTLHKSVYKLSTAYNDLEIAGANPLISELAEQEAANSVTVLNDLLDDTADSEVSDDELKNTLIANELADISQDLDSRWHGAIYALNPSNPDAARHFCISTREIITEILETKAPNTDVFSRFPDCPTTQEGIPTRSAKIRYCLDLYGRPSDMLENFIDTNIENVLILFKELNSGTHGPSGKFSLKQLISIKTRLEDAILFMCEIVKPNSLSLQE